MPEPSSQDQDRNVNALSCSVGRSSHFFSVKILVNGGLCNPAWDLCRDLLASPHRALELFRRHQSSPKCVRADAFHVEAKLGTVGGCVSSKLALACHNSNTKVTKPAVALQKGHCTVIVRENDKSNKHEKWT